MVEGLSSQLLLSIGAATDPPKPPNEPPLVFPPNPPFELPPNPFEDVPKPLPAAVPGDGAPNEPRLRIEGR